jgi:hypothetical protein
MPAANLILSLTTLLLLLLLLLTLLSLLLLLLLAILLAPHLALHLWLQRRQSALCVLLPILPPAAGGRVGRLSCCFANYMFHEITFQPALNAQTAENAAMVQQPRCQLHCLLRLL